jgi:type I restriction enzyme R subunit
MPFIVEQHIENIALEILEELGYSITYGPTIEPDSQTPRRAGFDAIVLVDRLEAALRKLNPTASNDAIEEAIKRITRISNPQTIENNKQFHEYLLNGIDVTHRENGQVKHSHLRLVDVENPSNNSFEAINQFTIKENKNHRRPDILIFVNGLPVGIIELKSPSSPTATIASAFDQIQTYKNEIPSLFTYNEFVILADGLEARMGTFTSPVEWFLTWRTIDGKKREPLSKPQLEIMLRGMLQKSVIVDLISHFTGFQETKKGARKIIAGYHQYHATNKAIENTIRAVNGNKKIGVVWHTQGSGKSLTMAFFVGKISRDPRMKNPSVVVLTDRNDLDDQLFNTFSDFSKLFRENPQKIERQSKLKEALKVQSGGIFFTTIQKFLDKNDSSFEILSTRDNVIVVADEAHRTQYGLNAKIKNEKLRYGFAKYLRDALPNASFLGFTGTPIDLSDKSTRGIFGNYIDTYDMHAALEDKRVVPIYYDSKIVKLGKNEQTFKDIDEDLEEITEFEESTNREYLKSKWSRIEALAGSDQRIQTIAKTIVKHYELRQELMAGKAIIVCMSRRICVELHDAIRALRPEWYHKEDDKGKIKVIMTGSAIDDVDWQEHIRTKAKRREMGELFKGSDSDFSIAIVRDMWLTGFDVPALGTIYIDKPIRQHNLMQAIARVNRVYPGKTGGLVIDFFGIGEELKKAVAIYTQNEGEGQVYLEMDKAVKIMQEKHEIVRGILHGFNYKKFFAATPKERLSFIPEMKEFILSKDKGKERFVRQTAALMRALNLAMATPEAHAVREDAALFQAIANSFEKNEIESTERKGIADVAIKQMVSKAINAEGIIDVYRELGIKKPEISILSDRFLDEFKDIKYKNLAFETLKKLLSDEIKSRFRDNIVKSRKFSEMLEEAIRKYQNRSIDSAQRLAEAVKIVNEMRDAIKRGEELGLSSDEEAVYDALVEHNKIIPVMADSDEVVVELTDDTLKKMASELANTIRNNKSIDWTYKQSVRDKLRVMVKRIMRKYGYPPSKQKIATDTVLEQAERMVELSIEG